MGIKSGGGGGGSCSFYYSIFMMHLNTRSKDCTEHTQINFSPKALASVFIQRQKLLLLIRPYSYSSANTRGAVCLMTMKATQVHGITPRQISWVDTEDVRHPSQRQNWVVQSWGFKTSAGHTSKIQWLPCIAKSCSICVIWSKNLMHIWQGPKSGPDSSQEQSQEQFWIMLVKDGMNPGLQRLTLWEKMLQVCILHETCS